MKNLLILFVAFFALQTVTAQTFVKAAVERSGTGFNVESGDSTQHTVDIFDKTYPIFTTSSGSTYIKLPKKDGSGNYPLWISPNYGAETVTIDSQTFPVGQTSKGSRFVLQKSGRGTPYPIWLGIETDSEFEGSPVRQTNSGKYFTLKLSNDKIKRIRLEVAN